MGNAVHRFNIHGGQPERSMSENVKKDAVGPGLASGALPAAAERALAEAEARREAYRARVAAMPKEVNGRGGEEPIRYGDWEVKGLAADF